MSKQINIYGTRKEGTRENWNGKYIVVKRDKKGRFVSWRKWSPKSPIKTYTEKTPIEIEYQTGREAYLKIVDNIKSWEWIERPQVEYL